MRRVIHLHLQAPAKPAPGQACNGCGVCCATAPCPVGIVVSRRTTGACAALVWHEGAGGDAGRYRCGLLSAAPASPAKPLAWVHALAAGAARRFISAGSGCDCDWEPQAAAAAID